MLRTFTPLPPVPGTITEVPPSLQPLFAPGLAATEGLLEITRQLGFSHFMLAFGSSRFPQPDDITYVWTSLPQSWVDEYEQRGFMHTDPRLQALRRRGVLVWDRETFAEPVHAAFFDCAQARGIGSGVAVPLRVPAHLRGIMSLSCPDPQPSPHRRRDIVAALGDYMLLGQYVYERVEPDLTEFLPAPRVELSAAETTALALVGKGYSDQMIGEACNVSPRTVEGRITECRHKLGAATRDEAVAKALALRLIET